MMELRFGEESKVVSLMRLKNKGEILEIGKGVR